MILLDAYPLVALLGAEPAGDEVRDLLREEECGMTSINLAEAADVLARLHDIGVDETRAKVEPLGLTVVEVDERLAWRAADLRGRHYRRNRRAVSLADCVLVCAARPDRDAVATADPAVIAMATDEGIASHPLPDSSGNRPS